MAPRVAGIFDEDLAGAIENSKVLVVGAGGIGCEILKNLVLTGFPDIEIIDLDTIDVSNLNRQFLFHKEHVGKSKAEVAKSSALSFNPNVKIVAHHDSVISTDYGLSYFKQFNMVLNALDNRVARNHVNRMCLAADVPLIETGTAGYAGQVELIKKGLSQCYECQPKPAQKTFPGCTIRNTPSEPIHCIVWAKHLFNQLFGEEDPDQDVSPDTADPEAAGDAGSSALSSEQGQDGNVERRSTRAWAAATNYDPEKLFSKLFHDDIRYLLSMENLWKKRRPPTPLDWNCLPGHSEGGPSHTGLPDQRVWSVDECAKVFAESCKILEADLKSRPVGDHLVWDKDEKSAMDFVTACANIRAHIFGISTKSRFEIKSMAGNIIPAIATANAIVAGLAVLRAQKILQGKINECTSVYLRPKLNHRGQLFVPEKTLTAPNPKCYVCAPKPEVGLACDLAKLTLKDLATAFKDGLNMQAPDATVEGKGVVILSSEEGETDHNNDKTLEELGLADGSALIVDDFLQNYEVRVRLMNDNEEKFWRLVTDGDEAPPAPKEDEAPKNGNGTNGNAEEPQPDTDVLLLYMHHFQKLKSSKVWIMSGTARDRNFIPIHDVWEKLAPEQTQNLMAFHAITGCDSTSKIASITKKGAWKSFQGNACSLLQGLGSIPLTDQVVANAEEFVVQLYKVSQEIKTGDAARSFLFGAVKNAENLPPTSDSLRLHIRRCHYQVCVWESAHIGKPSAPSPEDCGWRVNGTSIEPILMTLPPIPASCDALRSCGCKGLCQTNQCRCKKGADPCMKICNCRALCLNLLG